MSNNSTDKFLKERQNRQKQLVELKKMRQGVIAAPVAVESAVQQPKTLKEKLQNFWYYYKAYVIVIICIAAFIAVCVSQCANRTKYDYSILLFCHDELYDVQSEALAKNIAFYGKDVNGDGKVNADIVNCSYDNDTDYNSRTSKTSKIQANLTNASVLLYVTDDKAFDYYTGTLFEDFFVTLNLPDKDGKALKLNDNFYKNGVYSPDLPEDLTLYICRRAAEGTTIENNKNIDENIENADELLYNISAKTK